MPPLLLLSLCTTLGRRRTDGSFRNFTGTGRFIAHSHGSGIRSKRTADRDTFACAGTVIIRFTISLLLCTLCAVSGTDTTRYSYSVGSEIKFRTGDNWLETAGGIYGYRHSRQAPALYCYFQPYCPARQLRHVRHVYSFHGSWLLMT